MQGLDTFEVTGACKEESSDESTIISSQTSTLTRNQGKIYFIVNYHFALIINVINSFDNDQ